MHDNEIVMLETFCTSGYILTLRHILSLDTVTEPSRKREQYIHTETKKQDQLSEIGKKLQQ